MRLLCRIEDVFDITQRGCVVVPGMPLDIEKSVKIGSRLMIRNPDGRVLHTRLCGVETIKRGRPMDFTPLLLSADIKRADIAQGASLYLLENDDDEEA